MHNENTMALVLTAAKKKKVTLHILKHEAFSFLPCLAVCVSFLTILSTCQDDFVCDVTLHFLKHRETCEATADSMV